MLSCSISCAARSRVFGVFSSVRKLFEPKTQLSRRYFCYIFLAHFLIILVDLFYLRGKYLRRYILSSLTFDSLFSMDSPNLGSLYKAMVWHLRACAKKNSKRLCFCINIYIKRDQETGSKFTNCFKFKFSMKNFLFKLPNIDTALLIFIRNTIKSLIWME